MKNLNDIRYIENSGWNDFIFRQGDDPNDFSNEAYKRFNNSFITEISNELVPKIKKAIK